MPNEDATSQGVARLKLLRQPKFFSGLSNESVTDWLYEYEMIFDSAGVTKPEQARYLPLYLSGTALLWHRSLSEADKKNMVTLNTKMQANFSPRDSKEVIQKELWQRVLLPQERMLDYIYSKLELCRLSDPNMTEPDKIKWVSRGLPGFYREKIRGLDNKTIDELTVELLELEAFCSNDRLLCALGSDRNELRGLIREAFQECRISGGANVAEGERDSDYRYGTRETKPKVRSYENQNVDLHSGPTSHTGDRSFQRQFSRGDSKPRFRGECWRCGIVGHARRDCRVNMANRTLNDQGIGTRGNIDSNMGYFKTSRK